MSASSANKRDDASTERQGREVMNVSSALKLIISFVALSHADGPRRRLRSAVYLFFIAIHSETALSALHDRFRFRHQNPFLRAIYPRGCLMNIHQIVILFFSSFFLSFVLFARKKNRRVPEIARRTQKKDGCSSRKQGI